MFAHLTRCFWEEHKSRICGYHSLTLHMHMLRCSLSAQSVSFNIHPPSIVQQQLIKIRTHFIHFIKMFKKSLHGTPRLTPTPRPRPHGRKLYFPLRFPLMGFRNISVKTAHCENVSSCRNAVVHIQGTGSPQKKAERIQSASIQPAHIQPARIQPARCIQTLSRGGDSS